MEWAEFASAFYQCDGIYCETTGNIAKEQVVTFCNKTGYFSSISCLFGISTGFDTVTIKLNDFTKIYFTFQFSKCCSHASFQEELGRTQSCFLALFLFIIPLHQFLMIPNVCWWLEFYSFVWILPIFFKLLNIIKEIHAEFLSRDVITPWESQVPFVLRWRFNGFFIYFEFDYIVGFIIKRVLVDMSPSFSLNRSYYP